MTSLLKVRFLKEVWNCMESTGDEKEDAFNYFMEGYRLALSTAYDNIIRYSESQKPKQPDPNTTCHADPNCKYCGCCDKDESAQGLLDDDDPRVWEEWNKKHKEGE
jgi:hypothetical protein